MKFNFHYILLLLLFLFSGLLAIGQNETDVVRYLYNSPFGTARLSSMAGSFGALGGDLSAISINPAGSAIYRKSDVSATPGFTINNVASSIDGNSFDESKNKLVFTNIGYASTTASQENKDLYISFSLGYNKTNDFNRISSLSYANMKSSMLFSFTDRAYGIPPGYLPDEDPFVSNLAYEAYLIDPVEDTPVYYTTQPLYEESFNGVYQSNNIEESGSMGEFFLNFGIAINEKVHIGVSMDAINGKYEQSLSFKEDTSVDTLLLDNFIFRNNLESDLSGLDFKLGLIIKPEDWIRLGLSWHVPYQLNVTDIFSTSIRSQFRDGEFFEIQSPTGSISYSIKNPGKWILSTALIAKDKGLVNVDIEWMNYSNGKIISSEFDFTEENQRIANTLRNAITLRVGGEIWFSRYNFRLGYSFRQNPYSQSSSINTKDFHTFSGGAGFVTDNNIFVNLSCSYQQDSHSYYPYNSDVAPLISDDYNTILILASVGARF